MSDTRRYTRELLSRAAAECTTMDEVIAFLGTRPYGHLKRYLFKRFTHFGINVSHLVRRSAHGDKPRPTRTELRTAVTDSVSVSATLRRLGRTDNSRTRALLREWIAEDGLDTTHFQGQSHQQGRRTPSRNARQQVLVKSDTGSRTRSAVLRAALRDTGLVERCAECGIGPRWGGRPLTLEVDHINGDRLDNRLTNLRLLCPNCHATTDTWCRGSR